jgi:hypothetical protein
MAGGIELSISDADVAKPMSIPQSRVERACILLGYREDPSFFAVARAPELWERIIGRFSGASSNRTDCPPIIRSSGSGDHVEAAWGRVRSVISTGNAAGGAQRDWDDLRSNLCSEVSR